MIIRIIINQIEGNSKSHMETSETSPIIATSILAKLIKIPLNWWGTLRLELHAAETFIWIIYLQPYPYPKLKEPLAGASLIISTNPTYQYNSPFWIRNITIPPRIHMIFSKLRHASDLRHGLHIGHQTKRIVNSRIFHCYKTERIHHELNNTLLW